MQTFLPYPNFEQTAACLDNKRLGKQRVECLQIYKAIQDPTYGWQNHPIVKMWKGHPNCLLSYFKAIMNEWTRRGFKNTKDGSLENLYKTPVTESSVPFWLGSPSFHASHKSNLMRKSPEHYKKFFGEFPDNLPYVWFVN